MCATVWRNGYHSQIVAVTATDLVPRLQRLAPCVDGRATFTIPHGAVTALIGPNGAGKSTVLDAIAGLLQPRAGIARGARPRAAAAASPTCSRPPTPTSTSRSPSRETVTMGRYATAGLLRRLGPRRPRRHRRGHRGARPSPTWPTARCASCPAAQRQRAFVAQGLAQQAEVLLLDEPITGLDLVSRQHILDAIAAERAAGHAVVVSTHDLGDAAAADHLLLLAGRVVASGPPGRRAHRGQPRRCLRWAPPPRRRGHPDPRRPPAPLMTPTVHATAADRLRDDGQRYTTQRRALVDLLVEVEQPLTIPQLLERQPGLAQSSAYRNLAVLERAGCRAPHRHRRRVRPLRAGRGPHPPPPPPHLLRRAAGSTDFEVSDAVEHELESARSPASPSAPGSRCAPTGSTWWAPARPAREPDDRSSSSRVLVALGGCADRGLAVGPAVDAPAPAPGRRSRSPPSRPASCWPRSSCCPPCGRAARRSAAGCWRSRPEASRWPARSSSAPPCAASSCSTEPPDAEQAASLLRLSRRSTGATPGSSPSSWWSPWSSAGCSSRCSPWPPGSRPTPTRSSACSPPGCSAWRSSGRWRAGCSWGSGSGTPGFVLPALALPILVVAAVAAWPRVGGTGREPRAR